MHYRLSYDLECKEVNGLGVLTLILSLGQQTTTPDKDMKGVTW